MNGIVDLIFGVNETTPLSFGRSVRQRRVPQKLAHSSGLKNATLQLQVVDIDDRRRCFEDFAGEFGVDRFADTISADTPWPVVLAQHRLTPSQRNAMIDVRLRQKAILSMVENLNRT